MRKEISKEQSRCCTSISFCGLINKLVNHCGKHASKQYWEKYAEERERGASFRKSETGTTSSHPAELLTGCTNLGCQLLCLGTDSTCLAANSLTINNCLAEGRCYTSLFIEICKAKMFQIYHVIHRYFCCQAKSILSE